MNSRQAHEVLDRFLAIEYPITVYKDESGGYVAEIEDLPGCVTQAETAEDIFRMIEDARRGWIRAAYEADEEIPLPRGIEDYSGKFIVRIPRDLHRELAKAARRNGASLNQYVTALLADRQTRKEALSELKSRFQAVEACLSQMHASLYRIGTRPLSPAVEVTAGVLGLQRRSPVARIGPAVGTVERGLSLAV